MLIGIIRYDLDISSGGVLFGGILSLVLAVVIQFFILSVDYTKTEFLQFEDDEYYYYVKAVPKMTVSLPEKRVKKISGTEKDDTEKEINRARRKTE